MKSINTDEHLVADV